MALILCQQGSTPEDKQRFPSTNVVGSAILAGRWERANELLVEIRATKSGLGDGSMASLMDGGRIGADNYYANILTGIRLYKEAGANPNEANGKALYLAATGDKYGKIIERLLQYGADPNHRWYYPDSVGQKLGGTPPIGAASNVKTASILIKYRAKLNVHFVTESVFDPKFKGKVTPLIQAALMKNLHPLVPIYLNAGANPNLKCEETGMTALHIAAQYNYHDVILMLLKAKADKSLKDKNGRTPLAVARKYKSLKAIKALGGR
jgi:hypothetical protein